MTRDENKRHSTTPSSGFARFAWFVSTVLLAASFWLQGIGCSGHKPEIRDRPVAVPTPCLRASDIPPPANKTKPVLFYFCLQEWDDAKQKMVPDGNVYCAKRPSFENLVANMERYQDFVEKVRRQCAAAE